VRAPSTLKEAWKELVRAVDAPRPALPDEARDNQLRRVLTEGYAAFLGISALYATPGETPELAGAIERDVSSRIDGPRDEPRSLRDLFALELTATLQSFRLMERAMAIATLERLEAQEWALLPAALIEFVRNFIATSAASSLPAALMNARNPAQVEAVAQLHKRQSLRVLYALTSAAAGDITHDQSIDDETRRRWLASVGENLASICGTLSAPLDGEYFGSEAFAIDLTSLAAKGRRTSTLADYMRDARAGLAAPELLAPDPDSSTIPGVLDNELNRVLLINEKVVGMRYGRRTYAVLEPRSAEAPIAAGT